MKTKTRIFPLQIQVIDKRKGIDKTIGIEFKRGKFYLFGRENMDEGVKLFFDGLKKELSEWMKEIIKQS